MRKLYERIKRSRLYKKYLADGAFISFLKRGKHFVERILDRIRSKLKKYRRSDRILTLLHQLFYKPEEQLPKARQEAAVDVIVPIYNGYEYLPALFDSLPKAGMACRFLLIDDRSTDGRVKELEQMFVAAQENAVLLKNEENLGFVKSVNRALRESKGHVALVNSDTELPKGWLARLMAPILADEKVASVTPYSNSATIFSFPNFCYNNPIYRGLDVDTLDSYFRRVKPAYAQMPTGVGFCMGMGRKALDEVGLLDEETYGRGFGEENDWCQRAIRKGYRNVQAENLFVYHKHGGSFLSEEKERLIADHMEKLNRRFPGYDGQVSELIHRDPNRKLRKLLTMRIDTHETRSILYFDHSLGGGATSYLNRKKEESLKEGCCVSVVRFDMQIHAWRLIFENDREVQEYEIWSMEELLQVTAYFHYDEIYVNELVTYPHLWEMQRAILELKRQQGGKLIMLCHDFFPVCPTVNLLDTQRRYCGMPEEGSCYRCFLQKGLDVQYDCRDRSEWVANWKRFLTGCTEVRAFSQDTLRRMRDAFGEGLAYTLIPHQVDYMFPIHKAVKTTETLNIGIVGVLTIHKGSELVERLLRAIEKEKLAIRVTLIGYCDGVSLRKYRAFSETGPYQVQELPKRIYENDIDLFLISSIWPETFSYTTEEVIRMGMPLAAFDIGAPAERVRAYEKGTLLKETEPGAILKEIAAFAQNLHLPKYEAPPKKILYVAEYISFSSRYRLEHLREELLYQGILGEVWETKKLPRKIDWEEWAAVAVYRCRAIERLPEFIADAKAHGVPAVYDIDDYIFEYEAISDLPFLKDEEYRDFDVYSRNIHQCMEQCDRILVSTEHLRQAALQAFPGKPVYVNRNAASAEMLILSAMAQRKKDRTGKRLILGYFSGSNTHSRDFELISDLLLKFLKRHGEACLKIVGCLELPDCFGQVQDQIIREGFMEWQKLPESIAQVDINLMPLEDSFFHRCKSENKWMEAALARVPTIGSWNGEIAGATMPGENILLCKSQGEWAESLELLAGDPALRRRIAESAFQYVTERKTTLCKDRELLNFVLGQPLLSVFLMEDGVPEKQRKSCRKSIENQAYRRYEVIAFSGPGDAGAWQRARGEYVLFLSAWDLLAPDALQEVAGMLDGPKKHALIYSDEDRVSPNGKKRYAPFFKPDWSPDLFWGMNYVNQLAAYERTAAKRAWGQMECCCDSPDMWMYEFQMRFIEQIDAAQIGHIPRVLCHVRERAGEDSSEAEAKRMEQGRRVRQEAIRRRGISAHLEMVDGMAGMCMVYEPKGNPLVSIIIPSKDNVAMLRQCIDSIEANTDYKNYEIVLVDNGSSPENHARIKDYLAGKNVRYCYEKMEFHFSRMCNLGAAHARGEYLLFLNDDIEVAQKDWLSRLVGQGMQKWAGAVGAKLLYPNSEVIQHVGVANLEKGLSHYLNGLPDTQSWYFGRNRLSYNCIAVTGACLLLGRDKFREVGGFEDSLPVSFNDVDLCLKLYEAGYYNVVRNDVRLYHHESASRGQDSADRKKAERLTQERGRLWARHPQFAEMDPFYSVHLTQDQTDFSLNLRGNSRELSRRVQMPVRLWEREGAFLANIDTVTIDDAIQIRGWYYWRSDRWMRWSRAYLVLRDAEGGCMCYATCPQKRRDVADALQSQTEDCGFSCRIRREDLRLGQASYQIGVLAEAAFFKVRRIRWTEQAIGGESKLPC